MSARKLGAAAVVAAACMIFTAPALAATEPAAGVFVEAPETITSAKFAGGNEFYTLMREATFTGTYTGVGQADQRIVIHSDGSANVHMTIAFTGVACGQPVELTFLVTARVDFVQNTMEGKYTVMNPNGDVGQGQGTFTGTPSVGGAYEGDVHC